MTGQDYFLVGLILIVFGLFGFAAAVGFSGRGGSVNRGNQITKRPPPPKATGPRPDKIIHHHVHMHDPTRPNKTPNKSVHVRAQGWGRPSMTKSVTSGSDLAIRDRIKSAFPEYAKALEAQAKAAEARVPLRSAEGTTLDDFLDAGARRIMEKWSWSYDTARREFKDYVSMIAEFPDPAYNWSIEAARSLAEELMDEIGEPLTNG